LVATIKLAAYFLGKMWDNLHVSPSYRITMQDWGQI